MYKKNVTFIKESLSEKEA